ncbi:MAG TPA: VCBS repeat-containing protein [Opitutaceae bacterium]|nr:VCBS repeat-containing protein [Opitutaceae bacterium]
MPPAVSRRRSLRPARIAVVLSLVLLPDRLPAADGLDAAPLAARSRAPGAALFTPMPASQTGIVATNAYDDPRMWGERFQEFKFGAIGTGVAIGDCDGDGRPDLFVVDKTGPGRLFRNAGQWRFEDVTEKAGLGGAGGWMRGLFGGEDPQAWSQGATWADVNNDGRLDLYVCRFAAPNRLWINQGNGADGTVTFKEEAAARGLALADASGTGAFADFDRDGWLDVYVQTNLLDARAQPEGQEDRLYRNRRDGTFEDVTARAGIRGRSQGHAAIWWDYDHDGWPDLYVANDFAVPDRLYRNGGGLGAGFKDVLDEVVPRTPHSSMGADLGDVDNDGRMDLLVADMAATTAEKDQRGMAKIRSLLTKLDEDAPAAPQFMQNTLFVNTGRGRMIEAAQMAGLAATDWTWSVRLEDLDCDGWVDAHVTNGMVRELHNADLVQAISGTESPAEAIRVEQASPVLAERNLAFRNRGDLRFEDVSRAWGLDQHGVSFGAAFGDLDGDGDLDLVFANYQGAPTVLRNDAPEGNRLVVALRGAASNRFGVGATVRVRTARGEQVRQLVVSRGYLSSSEPMLHFGLGAAERVDRLVVEWPSGLRQEFPDLAANQRVTVTEPASAPKDPGAGRPGAAGTGLFVDVTAKLGVSLAAAEEPTAEPDAQALLPFRFNRRGPALAAGDLDGDGRDELVLGGTTRSPLRAGRWGDLPPGNADDGPVLLLDFDGDGDSDLLRTKCGASRAGNYQPQLWRNDGGKLVATDALPQLALSAGAAVAADFDRDGDLDVFLGARNLPGRYPQPPPSALLRNDGGTFVDATELLAPGLKSAGLVTSALASDADGDGWIDLLIATEWGTVRYFRNAGGKLGDQTEAAGFAAGRSGWWTSLAAADFNGDGRMDYVAGNVGLNTPYRTPAVLLAADFRGGSAPQLVEAREENGRLYPIRSRQELGAHIPNILRKYPRNDAFAKATVEEILGADKVAAARRFQADEFRSGVFLSRPDGSWAFAALPRLAQLAPLQGMVAGDLDGDGAADILAAQNSFAPIPPTGRFDGGVGVFLRGDGQGGFTAVPPAESGWVVPGDARSLVRADLDGDGVHEVAVSRNQAEVRVFKISPGR